jgi:glycosyltransferase involved in cell wall biosynthesis
MHILLITRHYPPEISGGARRPFLLTQAMRLQGHKVTLVTPFKSDNPNHIHVPNAAIDNGLRLQSYPNEAVARKPNPLDKLKNFLRLWLFWPDPDIRWARDVVKTLKTTDLKPDWIMTTSPPESIHIAGAALSQILGVSWLAEMRDTWISMPHRVLLERSKFRAFLERRIASKTLRQADAITSVSEVVMSEARTHCAPDTPELILPHFSKPSPPSKKTAQDPTDIFDQAFLNIVHTGGFSLSDRRRKLAPLLEALIPVFQKRPELALHIAGPLTQTEAALIKASPIRIVHHGSVPLKKAHAMQRQADGLLLYTPKYSHALPGKYAEYAMAERPILYFGSGTWLSLVEDKGMLRPMVSGLEALTKQEVVKPATVLSHLEAAERLVKFMIQIDNNKPSQTNPIFE